MELEGMGIVVDATVDMKVDTAFTGKAAYFEGVRVIDHVLDDIRGRMKIDLLDIVTENTRRWDDFLEYCRTGKAPLGWLYSDTDEETFCCDGCSCAQPGDDGYLDRLLAFCYSGE